MQVSATSGRDEMTCSMAPRDLVSNRNGISGDLHGRTSEAVKDTSSEPLIMKT